MIPNILQWIAILFSVYAYFYVKNILMPVTIVKKMNSNDTYCMEMNSNIIYTLKVNGWLYLYDLKLGIE